MALKTMLMALALVIGAGRAECEPMDLENPRARWVSVRSERSPAEAPGRLNSEYSAPIPAWFEPGPSGATAKVIIFHDVVEQRLFGDEAPVPGSFSDFVWQFDVETGNVTSARVSGALSRPVRWGFLRISAQVQIRIDMSTVRQAGYRKPRSTFGHSHNPLCHADDRYDDCVLVDPRALDQATGYVNAVGGLEVDSFVSQILTFSPLGEAVFSEMSEGMLAVLALEPSASPAAVGAPPAVTAAALASEAEPPASGSTRSAAR